MQTGESKMAERALRMALLSAQGAEFALGPLRGLGELFAEAKLLFRRLRPDPIDGLTDEVEAGISPARPETIH